MLEDANYNWFVVVEHVETRTGCEHTNPSVEEHLKAFRSYLLTTLKEGKAVRLFEQSVNAFKASVPLPDDARIDAMLNGEVVTDSDSDNPEEYVGLTGVASPLAVKLIEKKRKSISLRIRRKKAKTIASRMFLSRKVARKIKTIVDLFPDIGKTIDSFVQDGNVGADAWRRTGVLTFDGNRRIKQKVTFLRIKSHLEETYNCKFSSGTVIQLCVPRNLRHRAAKNYRGVAKVTC